MAAAVHLRRNLHPWVAPAHIKRAHSLGPINLVPGERKRVNIVGDDVDRNFAHRLHRVGVEEYAPLVTELADFGNRLQHANLAVGRHDRNQDGLLIDSPRKIAQIDQPVGVHRQKGHAEAVLFQAFTGVQHGLVLGHLGDDVVAALAVHLGDAFEGQVVALGGARGEDDLLGRGADQPRNLLARRFDALLGLPTKAMVAAGRIAELGCKVRHHRLQNPRIERGGGVVIHINRQLKACWRFHRSGNCAHCVSILITAPRSQAKPPPAARREAKSSHNVNAISVSAACSWPPCAGAARGSCSAKS